MKYTGTPDYQHGSEPRIGVLLVNLGTPEEPSPRAVRRYLAEFLWDPRVIELPRPLWWLILHLIIGKSTMAGAPASSSRRTPSRFSVSGEAPGMNGWVSVRPR